MCSLYICCIIDTYCITCVCLQHGGSAVRIHHLEYTEGGILDIDDALSDLVEDRDKVRLPDS